MESISAYFTNSDSIIKTALTISFLTVMLTAILVITIVILRIRLFFRHKRHDKVKHTWNPILANISLGKKTPLPALSAAERYTFLVEWNDFFTIVRGDSVTNLKLLARKLRVDEYARRKLHSKNLHDKLIATITLGHMREYSVWDDLILLVRENISIAAITAVRSLLLIDPKQGLKTVLPLLITEKHWPWASVAYALKLVSPDNVCASLCEITRRADAKTQIRLLRYMDVVHCDIITEGVTNILRDTTDPSVASVCLNIVQDVKALEIVRGYVDHPVWFLRMHAARALGKIGNEDDVPRLIELLSDSSWWVRYRSAQAIANITSFNKDTLRQLMNRVDDVYGRDMLTQVIAEI